MFLSDDESDEFFLKDNTRNNIIRNNDIEIAPKKPLCHFFIPKSVPLVHKIKDNNIGLVKNVVNGGNSFQRDMDAFDKSKDKSETNGNPIVTDDIPNSLSLISNPKPFTCFSVETLKKEKDFPTSFISPSSPSESFSSLPPLHASSVTKSTSDNYFDDDSDHSLLIKKLNLVAKKSMNIHKNNKKRKSDSFDLQESNQNISSSQKAITLPSCNVKTSNSSDLKLEPDVSSSQNVGKSCVAYPVYSSWETSSNRSSQSSVHSLHVDIDRGNSSNEHIPIMLVERLRSQRILKRKRDDLTSVKSSCCSSKRSKNSTVSHSDNFEQVRRTARRVMESDEETEMALENEQNLMKLLPRDNVGQDIEIFRSTNSILSMENNLIFCFKCNIDSETFCDKHPMETIFNLNVDCPFVEYLLDESYDQYTNNSIDVLFCCCNQNELDHIHQSLPDRFQVRESESSERGVWSRTKIAPGTIIGPYLGEIIENRNPEQLVTNRYKTRGNITSAYSTPWVEFAFKSNWLRCVNFTNLQCNANLKVIHYDKKVFFQAIANIDQDEELLLYNNIGSNLFQESLCEPDLSFLNHISVSRSPEEPDCTILSEKDIEDIPFHGTKYSKDMIIDIAKIWRNQPLLTISQTLEIVSKKHPKANTLSERYMSKLTRKYRLRHRGGANVKFDSQMREFVRVLLLKFPRMSVPVISQKLKERFPLRAQVDNNTLKKVIEQQLLRPGVESGKNTTANTPSNPCRKSNNQSQMAMRKDNVSNRSRFEFRNLKKPEKVTSAVSVTKPTTDADTNEMDIIANVRQIIKEDPYRTMDRITQEIKQRFPQDYSIDIETIKRLMRTHKIRPIHKNVRKIDDDMVKAIYDLRVENPTFSASIINHYMRRLMPHKPYVEPNSIYLVLRKFNLTNRNKK